MDFTSTEIKDYRIDLIIRYGQQVSPEILKDYNPADKWIRFHADEPELPTHDILLPDCPAEHLIDGFGLPARDQFYKPLEIPEELKLLPNKVDFVINNGKTKRKDPSLDDIWDYINIHQSEYKVEIDFIRKCWYHRLHGYWCYINSKPTYIDGWHWLYTNSWELDVGLPTYRDRDRKFFVAARYCYETTEAYFTHKVDYFDTLRQREMPKFFGNEKAAKEFAQQKTEETGAQHDVNYGDYYVDIGMRTVMGFLWPKHRREGATYRASCINFEITSRHLKAVGGLQSMDETKAMETWQQNMVKPWQAMFWIWKPQFRGSNQHTSHIEFQRELGRTGVGGGSLFINAGLQSKLTYATTGDEKYFDGMKLVYFHDDELGKLKNHDAYKRHTTTMPCLTQGDRSEIFGFTVKTSTSGEFNKGGGEAFYELCKDSNFTERNSNGQTQTGLLTFFIPANEGLDGFIDQYGNSVIETPTIEQANFIKRDIGAREYLDNQESDLLANQDNPKNQEKLLERYRLFPTKFKHCFMRDSSQTGFDIVKLSSRITELRPNKTKYQYGNYIRNKQTNRVELKITPDGRWRISKILSEGESNRVVFDSLTGSYKPINPKRRIACADPFKFDTTEGRRMSDGAGAVFERRNKAIDGDHKPPEFWVSHNFVCTYKNRPSSKDEYAEDMLAMSLYWGTLMSPEINVDLIWQYFKRMKCAGMLYYFYDPVSKSFNKNPGFNSLAASKQDMFMCMKDYIYYHIHKEKHDEILIEASDIPGIEKMKDFDIFTVAAGCLYTDENMNSVPVWGENQEEEEEAVFSNIDLLSYFQPA